MCGLRPQALHGEGCSEMLTVQYRMNTQIMDWSSNALYEGRVGAHDSVAQHTLADLVSERAGGGKAGAAAAAAVQEQPVLLLVDTAGCGFEEEAEEEGDSKANPGEARAVMAHVARLIKAGLTSTDIGVITPYNAQVALLKELRTDKLHGLEISSVDGFQVGRLVCGVFVCGAWCAVVHCATSVCWCMMCRLSSNRTAMHMHTLFLLGNLHELTNCGCAHGRMCAGPRKGGHHHQRCEVQ